MIRIPLFSGEWNNTRSRIWTHYFRGVEYINDFQPASCPTNETLMAVRVGAGEIGTDVQHKIAENGAVIVTGGNPVCSLNYHYLSFNSTSVP